MDRDKAAHLIAAASSALEAASHLMVAGEDATNVVDEAMTWIDEVMENKEVLKP